MFVRLVDRPGDAAAACRTVEKVLDLVGWPDLNEFRHTSMPTRVTHPMDRTLVICKPDAVERGLVGEIVRRLEAKNLRLVAAELRTISAETAGTHYGEHQGKPFYDDLVSFITRGPSLLLVVEGPEDTFAVVRTLMGATNPRTAVPGTIRGDLAVELTENLVHGSDSPESAAREMGLFFPGL